MFVDITPGKVPQQIHSAEKTAKAAEQEGTEHRFAIPASVSEQTAVPMTEKRGHTVISHCHKASRAFVCHIRKNHLRKGKGYIKFIVVV